MAYKFKGIESDKENLDYKSSGKIQRPNLMFGGDYLRDPDAVIEKAIEEHGIVQVDVNLILDRSQNEFEATTVITLKRSIRQVGLLSPVLLWQNSEKKYVLISGHRRVKAYRELVEDLQNEKKTKEQILEEKEIEERKNANENEDDKSIEKNEEKKKLREECKALEKEIEKYKTIPSIIFEIVDDNDSRLGTDSKYITRDIEKLMYEGSNMEARQLSKGDLLKHIDYFDEMIKTDENFKKKLLDERRKNQKNKASKLNIPEVVAKIISNDLGFSTSKTQVYRYLSFKENKDKYPKYFQKCMERIKNGEKVSVVTGDYTKACEIKESNQEKNIKREYLNRIENGNEPITDIYNECFDIKKKTKNNFDKQSVIEMLEKYSKQGKTLEQAIEQLKLM